MLCVELGTSGFIVCDPKLVLKQKFDFVGNTLIRFLDKDFFFFLHGFCVN